MAKSLIRWGILGAGRIARQFGLALSEVEGAELLAVASQSEGRAAAFVADSPYPEALAFDSYEALLQVPEVDVVYVANLNHQHKAATLLALESGKAVLCEKPFALNAAEAGQMIQAARSRGLFLMEAMWTRFNSINLRVREMISGGRLGTIQSLEATFGYFGGENRKERQLNREQGGGALLDVGIYPLSFSAFMLGRVPEYHASAAALDEFSGVDRQFSAVASALGDALVYNSASVVAQLGNCARIYGSKAWVEIPVFFNPSEAFVYDYGDGQEGQAKLRERLALEGQGSGYRYEIEEACEQLRLGAVESAIMPLDESLAIMKQMDGLRASWGLCYPGE